MYNMVQVQTTGLEARLGAVLPTMTPVPSWADASLPSICCTPVFRYENIQAILPAILHLMACSFSTPAQSSCIVLRAELETSLALREESIRIMAFLSRLQLLVGGVTEALQNWLIEHAVVWKNGVIRAPADVPGLVICRCHATKRGLLVAHDRIDHGFDVAWANAVTSGI